MEDKNFLADDGEKKILPYTGAELLSRAERYILDCRRSESDEAESERESADGGGDLVSAKASARRKKSGGGRFPNIAGFCRYLGIGTDKYALLCAEYRDETNQISAVFEDEALNSGVAATLLGVYLKTRLGYDSAAPQKKERADAGELKVIFEHDIISDGE